MKAQGWYRDPYLVHEDRYFSDGQPTKLVRDGGKEDYDPPPTGPPGAELAEARSSEPAYGADLRRADDPSAGTGYDPKAPIRHALNAWRLAYSPSPRPRDDRPS